MSKRKGYTRINNIYLLDGYYGKILRYRRSMIAPEIVQIDMEWYSDTDNSGIATITWVEGTRTILADNLPIELRKHRLESLLEAWESSKEKKKVLYIKGEFRLVRA